MLTENEFMDLAEDYNLIPVYREIIADTETPVSLYRKLTGKNDYSFLLESATTGKKLNVGRYSFIGLEPEKVIKYKNESIIIADSCDEVIEKVEKTGFTDYLEDYLAEFKPYTPEDLPPFSGGLVGYFGYEMISSWEDIYHGQSDRELQKSDLPRAVLVLAKTVLAYDHLDNTLKIINNIHLDGAEDAGSKKNLYREARSKIDTILQNISLEISSDSNCASKSSESLPLETGKSNTEKAEFEEMVEKAQEYIREGEAFQIVLSQRFSMEADDIPPFLVYRALRVSNPSPYMFFLNFPDIQMIGSSPEVLVKVEDEKIISRPLAGTRPRGGDIREDKKLQEELVNDEKERAEHTMLVDLGRNDVGKVSEYGSVEVTELMEIELYSSVMHLASQVEGIKKRDVSALKVLASVFPAGTVSGAPKIRAVELIDQLEKDPRGPYAGAVGYVDFSGNMDTCITIRTIFMKNGVLTAQIGAGMVADSEPAKEHQEILDKAEALFAALRLLEEESPYGLSS